MPEKNTAVLEPAREAEPKSSVKITKAEDISDRWQRVYDAIAKRAFSIFESNGKADGHAAEDWFQAESELFQPLDFKLTENDKNLAIDAQVPGFTEKDLQVSAEPTWLAISGKRETTEKKEDKKATYEEFSSSEIFRRIDLPQQIDPAKVTATLKKGVLHLELPKVGPQSTKIEVTAAAG